MNVLSSFLPPKEGSGWVEEEDRERETREVLEGWGEAEALERMLWYQEKKGDTMLLVGRMPCQDMSDFQPPPPTLLSSFTTKWPQLKFLLPGLGL